MILFLLFDLHAPFEWINSYTFSVVLNRFYIELLRSICYLIEKFDSLHYPFLLCNPGLGKKSHSGGLSCGASTQYQI